MTKWISEEEEVLGGHVWKAFSSIVSNIGLALNQSNIIFRFMYTKLIYFVDPAIKNLVCHATFLQAFLLSR